MTLREPASAGRSRSLATWQPSALLTRHSGGAGTRGAAGRDAKLKTYTLRYGPVRMAASTSSSPRRVRTPRVNGYIVRMTPSRRTRKGRPVTIRDVMLHHVVFSRRRATAVHGACPARPSEAFYGTGEENQ